MCFRKIVVVALAAASLFVVTGQATGQRGRGMGPRPQRGPSPVRRHTLPRPPVGSRRVVVAGVPYWLYGGVYYRLGHDGYIVVSTPVIRVLPRHHRVVRVGGVIYYVVDDVYYRPAPGGYIIVERPVEMVKVVAKAPEVVEVSTGSYTLHVPKRTGEGFVAVTLEKLDGGFLGPQGEFYPTMPPIALLTEMYGIPEILRQERSDVFFIHVPNRDGESFTRVTLTRHNGGFLGPQGEFYPLMPSVAHLAEMYGTDPVPAEPAGTGEVRIRVQKGDGQGSIEIVLTKHEQGYLGPQGEFYPELPSAEQLREMYGGQ